MIWCKSNKILTRLLCLLLSARSEVMSDYAGLWCAARMVADYRSLLAGTLIATSNLTPAVPTSCTSHHSTDEKFLHSQIFNLWFALLSQFPPVHLQLKTLSAVLTHMLGSVHLWRQRLPGDPGVRQNLTKIWWGWGVGVKRVIWHNKWMKSIWFLRRF